MIKIILGLITFIFIGLVLYVYMNNEIKSPGEDFIHETVKTEVVNIETKPSVIKDTSTMHEQFSIAEEPLTQDIVKKETDSAETFFSEDMPFDNDSLDDNPLQDGEVVDISEENPEKIIEAEIDSGLTEREGVDDTPLDIGI